MNEFDDRELRDALRRRAGGATEGFGLEAAHSAVVARAGRVRRRRAAVAGGAAMAGVIAAAVFVIGPGTDSVVTTPGDRTTGVTPASVDATSPIPTGPDPTGPDQDVIGTTPPTDTSPSPATTVSSTAPPPGASTTAPAAPETTVNTPPTSPEPTPPTAPTSTSPPGPGTTTETYSSAGGSITVGWDGSTLSLEDVSAAVGFESEVEDERADRIRVRFEDGEGGDFRIEIRIENGEVVRVE